MSSVRGFGLGLQAVCAEARDMLDLQQAPPEFGTGTEQ